MLLYPGNDFCVFIGLSFFFISLPLGFRRNEEMRAMEVLPILKEKVAFLSGKTILSVVVLVLQTPTV